ncbi:MAG: ATP-binding protein [Elusimicrobia bacterium]|nr:ATP-binding protein [Elusimicrobiota bacterium]
MAAAAPDSVSGTGDTRLVPAYTFEEFVVGPHNRFPHAASLAVSENLGKAYNPLFLYGPVGIGKTHLMQAVGHRVLQRDPNTRVLYVTAQQFMTEVIELLQAGRLQNLRGRYRALDLLLVDDIQFLATSEATQEEFFHMFNDLHAGGKQIIMTSDRPPKMLTTLEDRLRSRFEWGLIADIKFTNLETRVAILKKKEVHLKGFHLADDIRLYIASRLKSNIRELEGFLRRIQAYTQLNNEEISLDLVKEILKELLPPEEWGEEGEHAGPAVQAVSVEAPPSEKTPDTPTALVQPKLDEPPREKPSARDPFDISDGTPFADLQEKSEGKESHPAESREQAAGQGPEGPAAPIAASAAPAAELRGQAAGQRPEGPGAPTAELRGQAAGQRPEGPAAPTAELRGQAAGQRPEGPAAPTAELRGQAAGQRPEGPAAPTAELRGQAAGQRPEGPAAPTAELRGQAAGQRPEGPADFLSAMEEQGGQDSSKLSGETQGKAEMGNLIKKEEPLPTLSPKTSADLIQPEAPREEKKVEEGGMPIPFRDDAPASENHLPTPNLPKTSPGAPGVEKSLDELGDALDSLDSPTKSPSLSTGIPLPVLPVRPTTPLPPAGTLGTPPKKIPLPMPGFPKMPSAPLPLPTTPVNRPGPFPTGAQPPAPPPSTQFSKTEGTPSIGIPGNPGEIPVVFFYPTGHDKELIQLKRKFEDIIKKHKLKFVLHPALEVDYSQDPSIPDHLFVEKCQQAGVNIGVVLGPSPDSGLQEGMFFSRLQDTFDQANLSLQVIPWDELSKDYRFLNLALDITLIRIKQRKP